VVTIRRGARVLEQRRLRAEEMDQPGLERAEHTRALGGLARINWWSRSAGILWPQLVRQARGAKEPLRILDVATGAGDVPIRLSRWARRKGIRLQIEGCDVSAVAVEHAQRRAEQEGADVRFFVHDGVAGPLLSGYDVAMSSLFLHHLERDTARAFLARLAEQARDIVLINDLVRCIGGWLLAYVGTRLLSRSWVVHTDGPRSVAGAFTVAELRALAGEAGLGGAEVERRWPCRMLLTWRRRS
jgi:2-polyprenyl-3-methyl-5-hydroxy-6-metoxy-1,4-benzoquinol methylase